MADRYFHRSDLPFGRVFEIQIVDNGPVDYREIFEVPPGTDLFTLSVCDPEGNPLEHPDGIVVEMQPKDGTLPTDVYRAFHQNTLVSVIFIKPMPGKWVVTAKSRGGIPFAVNVSAIDIGRMRKEADVTPDMNKWGRIKCGACKTATKGLALAIVAAIGGAGAAALPASLLAAVGILGSMAVVAATAFVKSLIGDGVKVVSEKLCRAVRLC